MITAAELDDRVAAFELDRKVAAWQQQQQVRQRARERYWAVMDAHAEDLARRKLRSLVLAGGKRCVTCREVIEPWDRWVVDGALRHHDVGAGPEHAGCVVDVGRAV